MKFRDRVKNILKKIFANKKLVIFLVFVLLGTGYFIWKRTKTRNSQQTIQTSVVQKGTIVSTVSASGNVIASNVSTISTQASGVVKTVYMKEGDKVYAGEKIAEINLDQDGSLAYAQAYSSYLNSVNSLNNANNSLRSAQASLDNVYDQIKGHDTDETFAMKETRTRAEVARDNAYNSVQSAKASLNAVTLSYRLNSPIIIAPSSGTISSLTIAEGMSLGTLTLSSGTRTGQRVASLTSVGNPLLSVNISEIDVPNVKTGQKVTVTFDSISDKTFSGVVAAIDRVGSTTSNVTNYPAIVKLDLPSDAILPNMTATANIITEIKNDVLVVPSGAVLQEGGQDVVRVIKGGQQETVNVEVGISSDSQTEIIPGLSQGDEIVTSVTSTSSGSGSSQRSVFSSGGGFGGTRVIAR